MLVAPAADHSPAVAVLAALSAEPGGAAGTIAAGNLDAALAALGRRPVKALASAQ